jgi:cytoskeletal protein RodZ
VDYRNVLANVLAASVAGLAAFMLRLAFPQTDPLLLAIVAAAVYAGLWTIIGDHTRALLDRHLPPSRRLERHWQLVSATVGLCAVAVAGVIVALVVSHHAFAKTANTTTATGNHTTIEQLNQKVIVTHETIIVPVPTATPARTTIITRTAAATPPPVATTTQRVTTPATTQPTTTITPTQNPPSAPTQPAATPTATAGG